uniref:uncharacterized protein LOC120325898 n=1 Tax=Styela clava TaxID=7725 RepID=UPI001939D932|nr:uncharacterized protein LOC120325898 [Styela clava]
MQGSLSKRNSTDWLESCGAVIKSDVAEKIKLSISRFNEFSYMSDECTDVNGKQVLSHCIRFLDDCGRPTDAFLDVENIQNTSAIFITECILKELDLWNLDPKKMVSCSFDGAANFAGKRGGVQALLRQKINPNLIFIHCRGHLLQLALVRASVLSKDISKAISLMSSMHSFFDRSPKRLSTLENIQISLDQKKKLVQPSWTRWLSHERSLSVVLGSLEAILIALESIYQDGGDFCSDAGGLLLILRCEKTIAVLSLV